MNKNNQIITKASFSTLQKEMKRNRVLTQKTSIMAKVNKVRQQKQNKNEENNNN